MNKLTCILVFVSTVSFSSVLASNSAHVKSDRVNEVVKPWTNDILVMQTSTNTCGAAAIATILNGLYLKSVTERDVIDALGKSSKTSFAELATVLEKFGFKGIGLAPTFDELVLLKVPVIVYVRLHNISDHFSVLRGFSNDEAWLADPASGNLAVSIKEFRRAWENHDDPKRKGKVLMVLPITTAEQPTQSDNFRAPNANQN